MVLSAPKFSIGDKVYVFIDLVLDKEKLTFKRGRHAKMYTVLLGKRGTVISVRENHYIRGLPLYEVSYDSGKSTDCTGARLRKIHNGFIKALLKWKKYGPD